MVYKDSFSLPLSTSDGNDHRVIIMMVDIDFSFLREGVWGLWSLSLFLSFKIWEVFYIQNLATVPSKGGSSLSPLGESS